GQGALANLRPSANRSRPKFPMSQPGANHSAAASAARGHLRGWLWIISMAFVVVICFFLAVTFHSHSRSPDPTAHQLTNTEGAVALSSFVDPETHRWRSVPGGTQVFDGVTFVCEGAVRIAGLNAARDGKHYPCAVL